MLQFTKAAIGENHAIYMVVIKFGCLVHILSSFVKIIVLGFVFYNLFLLFYSIGIRIAASWNPKAKKWVEGRRFLFDQISKNYHKGAGKIVWMHCASLGEFEQGRPVLDALKSTHPTLTIVVSFFSPSGLEVVKKDALPDYVFYLPMDSISNANKFIDIIQPNLVLWVKYEYWYHYLDQLKKRGIPVLLISGVFRKSQPFFKWYGQIWRKMLNSISHFFLQNESSQHLLNSTGNQHASSVSGDTRFDRVIAVTKKEIDDPIIQKFILNKPVIVAGSTWEDDEIILAAYLDETNHREKLLLVPHELDEAHLSFLKKIFKKSVCYTALLSNPVLVNGLDEYNCLIVDTVGLLSRLYQFGYVNYVGGGFTADGVHNTLEAAIWGRPVIFGENYQKYEEAVGLMDLYGADSISDVIELKDLMDQFQVDKSMYESTGTAAKEFVLKNAGATNHILEYIQVNRLLTN